MTTGLEVSVTLESTIVSVYFSSPGSPSWTTLCSPFGRFGFTLTSTSYGTLLVYSCVPLDFAAPTFTILLIADFVCTGFPSSDFVTLPFTIV